MNFIKKVLDRNIDGLVHLQFQKFSKGIFPNKAVIHAKKSAKNVSISTTAEFANDLVLDVAKELGENSSLVTGAIISTINLKELPQYSSVLENCQVKQFQGVKSFLIKKEMTGTDLIKIVEAFPKAFFGLSFSSLQTQLKIKPKAPKSGKPSKKDGESPKPDFCKFKTTNETLIQEFIFENSNFKSAQINHTFIIEEIEIPLEAKKTNDFALMREAGVRIGKILRESNIDEVLIKKEIPLRA
jgi:hypothetical protein